jgi:hypothetical protein
MSDQTDGTELGALFIRTYFETDVRVATYAIVGKSFDGRHEWVFRHFAFEDEVNAAIVDLARGVPMSVVVAKEYGTGTVRH